MKRAILTTIIALCGLSSAGIMQAQDQQSTLRERLARRQNQQQNTEANASNQLSLRSKLMDEAQVQEVGNVTWKREIYRFLDMNKSKNAVLYYPVKPTAGRMNFFNLIFRHVLNGDIPVYEYQLDGSEHFADEYRMKIDSSFFLKFDIPFEVKAGKYVVNQIDIPAEEIRGYYLKETWFFDKNNSVLGIKTDAVCPVMMYQKDDDYGLSRVPLFWLPYESIKPYASQMPIMVSSLNNASTQTINDFFVKHNFDGEIYKTADLTNQTLIEQFRDQPDSLKKEQKKIEAQLKQFDNNLWVYNDSIGLANKAVAKKSAKKTKTSSDSDSDNTTNSKASDRATVQKEAKQQKSSPIRTMRNRKRN
jgi:gliding motility associated protien GldN